ncbi:hypothetical protein AKI39_19330 [Bordetella sp. H567]|uniref:HrpE/YscL family type III secretion apparatus protein n=1 Tax=Bordetella sp. H567 TaxID=1697043 RepID=UPI00081C5E34|nr:HrpE/YscL family type III secretion apparatus protein [Bordetella sp. H567]AOB32413.1 hypothetical protein AKI39_19330 [Bordetella sp. H567]
MTFLVDTRAAGDGPSRHARVTPVGKIVRRAEHLALLDAQGVLAQARADAARIVEQARDVYRSERDRGYAEGRQSAQAEEAAAMMRISQRTSAYLKEVERDMVDVVAASLRKIVGEFDAPDRILAVVRGGLALLRQQKNVLLRVHTDDAAFVRQHMQMLLSQFPSVDYIDVVADDRYARGACRIETPIGTIETSLDRQLDVLQHALERAATAAEDARPDSRQAPDHV